MKKILYLLFLIFTLNFAQSTENTPYSINFGAGLNYNMYFSDFKELPTFQNCCTNFDFASGISYYFYLGADIKSALFGINSKYGLSLTINDFSAKYKINDLIGYDLELNTYRPIFVDHNLKIDYLIAGISPYIWLSPFDNLPLDFKIGLNLGLPIIKKFDQNEELISPSNLNFKNGTKFNNVNSGELPEANSIYLGSIIGARYKFYSTNHFDFAAELLVNYGFTPPVSNYKWSNLALSGGLNISYNIPKAEEIRESTPPMLNPIFPQTPEPPSKPILSIKIVEDNLIYNNNDTIVLEKKVNKYNYLLSYIPVLFFEKDNVKPKSSFNIIASTEDVNFFEIMRKSNFSENYPIIINEFIKNNNLKVEIISQSHDENEDILRNRIELVRNNLISSGVSPQNISSKILKVKPLKDERDDLLNELRRIDFKFSDGSKLITSNILNEEIDTEIKKKIYFSPEVKSEIQNLDFVSYYEINNSRKENLELNEKEIILPNTLFEENKLNKILFYAKVTDTLNQSDSKEITLFLRGHKDIKNIYNNITGDNNSALILGYFDFDKTEFTAVDNNVLYFIKNLENKDNYIIEIIPSTDNFGTIEYNQSLAQKRAKSALKILGLSNSNETFRIVYPEKEIFDNSTPYGRFLNRSVLINIKQK